MVLPTLGQQHAYFYVKGIHWNTQCQTVLPSGKWEIDARGTKQDDELAEDAKEKWWG